MQGRISSFAIALGKSQGQGESFKQNAQRRLNQLLGDHQFGALEEYCSKGISFEGMKDGRHADTRYGEVYELLRFLEEKKLFETLGCKSLRIAKRTLQKPEMAHLLQVIQTRGAKLTPQNWILLIGGFAQEQLPRKYVSPHPPGGWAAEAYN
jgi:hypothetical protein